MNRIPYRARCLTLRYSLPLAVWVDPTRRAQSLRSMDAPLDTGLRLYKILFHFKALLWESIIRVLPHPTLLQYYCTTIAQYTTRLHLPPRLYAVHHTIFVMAISCKGQHCVCVSSVWVGPLCGSVPCYVGRPSVRGGPLWVGPLWVPSLPVFPSFPWHLLA